jgi:hypothetical protein
MNVETLREIGIIANRSVRRTLRQPALIVPTILFPLMLLAINASGLDVTKNIPNFPADSYLDFALVVTFMQGGLFAATTAGTELATDIETGFLNRLQLTPLRAPAARRCWSCWRCSLRSRSAGWARSSARGRGPRRRCRACSRCCSSSSSCRR